MDISIIYCYRCFVQMDRILTCPCGRGICAGCFAHSQTCYFCYGPFTAAATLRLRRERLRELSERAFQAQREQQECGLSSNPVVMMDWPINIFLQIDDRLHANARAATAAATPAVENAPSVASELSYFTDSDATFDIASERERRELLRRDRDIEQDLEMLGSDSDRSSDSFEFFMPDVARPQEQPGEENAEDNVMDDEDEESLDAMFLRDHLEGDPWENGNLYELEFDARIERGEEDFEDNAMDEED